MNTKQERLHYHGGIDEDFIASIADMLNGVLVQHFGQRKDLKKICGFALELLDNGLRYGSDQRVSFSWTLGDCSVIFELENNASDYNAERLLHNSTRVLSMSEDQVKEEFKKQMLNPEFGQGGGAGLGLLQLVKKGAKLVEVKVSASDSGEFICKSTIEAQLTPAL